LNGKPFTCKSTESEDECSNRFKKERPDNSNVFSEVSDFLKSTKGSLPIPNDSDSLKAKFG
jgi:hypothetical protein